MPAHPIRFETETSGMLDLMRKNAGSWVVKALLGAIVVVFVFWGVGSWTSHQEGVVATVDGEAISRQDYTNEYNRLMDQVRQNFGAGITDEMLKSLQLETQALNQLIDRLLLKQAAARLDLRVADEELVSSIRSIPAFQSGGVFDPRRYQQMLPLNRLTPEAFEVMQRDALLFAKLQRVITDSVKVSEAEVADWYTWSNAAVKIDHVPIASEKYAKITASPEEVAQYFERNKESYRTEPELQARYLRFTPEAYLDKVALTDAEVRDAYDSAPERFEIPQTVEARHILLKMAPDAAPEAVEKTREQLVGVLKQAREGKDFAALAKQYSEDSTREQGGALGAFRREAMIQPFADVAFSLKPGEISEPVRTRFGWHLIKVEKVNAGRTRSFEEVAPEIASQLKGERARGLAYDDAEAVYDAASGTGDLAGAAAARKLALHTTDFFTRRGPVKGVPKAAEFAQAAFQLAPGEVSDIQDFGDGYTLLQVADSRPARIPELAPIEARVKQDAIREKQAEQAGKDARVLLADVKNGAALEPAAKKAGLTAKTTDFFKRGDSPPDLANEPEVTRAAFELSEREPLPAEPIKTSTGYSVIRFREKKPPAAGGLEAEKAQIQDRLLQQKKSKTWEAWLDQLRQSSEIVRKKDIARS
jgi:peptidyl-prolyl cis-trans isomerase D